KAYQLMKQIKQIFDPDGLMNPDVILTTDKSLHSKNLKPIPQADSLIDHCMECGFCESVCPSRELTLTPRQRIAMYRNWIQLKDSDPVQAKAVYQTFDYHGIQTCATTGVCKIECPVGINTGDLVKKLKSERKTNWLSAFYINHLKAMTNLTKGLLKISSLINKLLPASLFNLLGKGLHLLSLGKIPKISSNIPTAAKSIPIQWLKTDSDESADSLSNDNQVIYFPTCASRTFGNQSQAGNIDLNECIHELLTKAGFQVIYPENFESLCCGQVMESEGSFDLAESTISELEKHLLSITNSGEIPVIMDNASCNLRAKSQLSEKFKIYDVIEFASERLLDKLTIQPIDETVLLHITCSDKHMANGRRIRQLMSACTNSFVETESIACCGWAGHKGFTTPELNQSALKKLNQQVPKDCKRGFSNSLTCEIGLSHYAEVPFQSVLYLLNEVSESKKS
ncbi:MAG: 4Fe-4S dicluster domain-containing protein, partial [Gammaproteobacteria bacterium]|nr:4Fe-4S dicluster domain-containing protein [Gammaproteobacteria bacterium]